MNFKAGDRVKCIDNEHVEKWFSLDEIYIITVTYRDGEHVCFAHTGVSLWHSWRFELIGKEKYMKENYKVTNAVSDSKFKAGDKVKCIDNLLAEGYFKLNEQYVIDEIPYDDHVCFTHAGDVAWDADRFELIEKEDTVKEPKQFNPEPGDKIICNNGEEFTCCTMEFLQSKNVVCYGGYEIHAYRYNRDYEYTGITWMGWSLDGKSTGSKEWDIREVTPKDTSHIGPFRICDSTVENGVLSDVVAPKGLYYDNSKSLLSKEDILNAWGNLGWLDESLEIFMKSINKVTNPEYKEYLRLKAMFESEE